MCQPVGMEAYPDGFMESLGLHMYHDSSWGKEVQPYGSFVVMLLNNGAVQWALRKIDSATEVETAIAARASKDKIGVRMVLADIQSKVREATALLGDCKATKDIITKPGSTQNQTF